MGKKLCRMENTDGSHHAWLFYCPGCRAPHQCDDRWAFNGDEEKPTFTGSVLVQRDGVNVVKCCHSYVTDGKIEFLSDSTHRLSGVTVDLPDWGARKG